MTIKHSLLSLTLLTIFGLSIPAIALDDEPDIPKLQKDAEAGDAEAQFELGSAYQQGEGVPQNDLQAVHWITKAANQGNIDAMFDLGMVYRGGYGVTQDLVTAYMWLEMAVMNGSIKAFDLRRDVASTMTLGQIDEAKYRATHWKKPEEEQ